MKRFLSLLLAVFAASGFLAPAAITVPGANGTDGALNITADTEIDLSQAVTATWDSDNSADAGKGVYDADKWAVVFKYTSVNVAAGATVTFKNHPSRAPVVWLVSGDVTIGGAVNLNGEDKLFSVRGLSEPGPGGFRGGAGFYSGVGAGSGFGPSGGERGDSGNAGGGSHQTVGEENDAAPIVYGNPSCIPLVGGSGGGGAAGVDGSGGGGEARFYAHAQAH